MLQKIIFSAAITASLSVSAVALEDVKSKKLENILVTGTRFEGPVMPLASNITLITAEEIRLSGAKQVSEVLRTQAGIQLQDTDGSGGRSVTVSMRGFSSNAANNTLILVDGRKLNNQSLASPDLNGVALADVQRIEVVQGSAGVLFGDQAVGGVINIITKRAALGEVSGAVNILRGSYGQEEYAVNLSQGFDNGLSYRLSTKQKNNENYRDNNYVDYKNALLNVAYEFSAGRIFGEVHNINDNMGLPGYLSLSEARQNPRQTNTPENFSHITSDLLRTGGEVSFSQYWTFAAEYSWRDEDKLFSYGTPTEQHTRVKNFTPRIQGEFDIDAGTVVATLGYDQLRSTHLIPTWFTDSKQKINATYAQLVYPLSAQLTISAGARNSQLKDTNKSALIENRESADAFEFGVSYQMNDALRLFARSADAFRFANGDENGYSLANVDFLKTQTSNSKELGVELQSESLRYKVAYYDMKINDEIFYDAAISNPQWWDAANAGANINLPKSSRKGLLLETDFQLYEELNLRINYSYTKAVLESGSFIGKQVPFVAEQQANMVLSYAPIEHWTFFVDMNYTGPRYKISDDANTQEKLASLSLFNANVNWTWQAINVGLRVKNLTNRRYSNYHGYDASGDFEYLYPQPDRTYELQVGYSF